MKGSPYRFAAIAALGLGLLAAFSSPKVADFEPEQPLWEVLVSLGRIRLNTPNDSLGEGKFSAAKGEQLVLKGFATDENGKASTKISKRLPCATCHALQNEYHHLGDLDPDKRLRFLDSLNRPLLLGPSLEGMVNRIYFFADDYQNKVQGKHKDLLKKGHLNLRAAIQACNQVYADGRELERWELESILAYLWTLELRMKHIRIEGEDAKQVKEALAEQRSNAKAVNILRQYYTEVYPANFGEIPSIEQRRQVSPVLNSFANGYRLYKRSCLHCHDGSIRGIGYGLDERQANFQVLRRHFDDTSSRHSIYNALRYNPNLNGGNTLPHFTEQRLSLQQLQDLRFYIYEMARLGDEAYLYHKVERK